VHALFKHLRERGFTAAPEPFSFDDKRECVSYIEGFAPSFPYGDLCTSEETLRQIGTTLRQYHDATVDFVPPPNASWSTHMSDPEGGEIICHNDVLPENVVFQDQQIVGLLDFDFAAPGRRTWDLARSAVLWIPIDDPIGARSYKFGDLDPFTRLRLLCDAYGLPMSERSAFLDVLQVCTVKSEAYVRAKVDACEPAFVDMWTRHNIGEIYERRKIWLRTNKADLLKALLAQSVET
jgi:thiamine kinase-like enzyme